MQISFGVHLLSLIVCDHEIFSSILCVSCEVPIKYGTNVVVFPCRACMLYCLRLKLYKICGNISTPLFISPDTTFCCFIVLLLMQLIEPQKWNRYFNRQTTAPEQFTCYILPLVKAWIHARARALTHGVLAYETHIQHHWGKMHVLYILRTT